MSVLESMVVVGPAASGRSTLVAGLRGPEFKDLLTIPTVFSTRPSRYNDNPDEIVHLDPPEFKEAVEAGEIEYPWSRLIDYGKPTEDYAFQSVPASDPRLVIRLGNSALPHAKSTNSGIREMLKPAQVVIVGASAAIREERLRARSPGISAVQLKFQLAEAERDAFAIEGTEIIIDTNEGSPAENQRKLQKIVMSQLAFNHAIRTGRFIGSFKEFREQQATGKA